MIHKHYSVGLICLLLPVTFMFAGENSLAEDPSFDIAKAIRLPVVKLGLLNPGAEGSFLVDIQPSMTIPMEVVGASRSCSCTKLRFVDGKTIDPKSPFRIELKIQAASSQHGEMAGEVLLGLREVEQRDKEQLALILPFTYLVEKDIDAGPESESSFDVVDVSKPGSLRITNNTGFRWANATGVFEDEKGMKCSMAASMDELSDTRQIVKFDILPIAQLLELKIGTAISGTVTVFAKKAANADAFSKVTQIPISVRISSPLRVTPAIIYPEENGSSIELNVLLSTHLPALKTGEFTYELRGASGIIESQLHLKSGHWIELTIEPSALWSEVGKSLTLSLSKADGFESKTDIVVKGSIK